MELNEQKHSGDRKRMRPNSDIEQRLAKIHADERGFLGALTGIAVMIPVAAILMIDAGPVWWRIVLGLFIDAGLVWCARGLLVKHWQLWRADGRTN